jgi:polysaccharide biosynthesis protein PslH
VRELSGRDGITVTGAVADVRPYVAKATVAIAPLHIARGIQNKVLEAMSMGRAVVATPQALEGLDVTAGEHVLEATDPAQWEQALMSLVADDGLRRRIEQSARPRVEERYSWAVQMAPLVDLCVGLAGGAGGRSPAEAGGPNEH